MYILSGLPPGDAGTGRLVTHLKTGIAAEHLALKLFAQPDPPIGIWGFLRQRQFLQAARLVLRYLLNEPRFRRGLNRARRNPSIPLLILHPQTLGYRLTARLMAERRIAAALFLLDSSFFCVASYNQVAGEYLPCQRCLGGDFAAATRMGCAPFPKPDPDGYDYTRELYEHVRNGRVVAIAQNARQAELAQRHFGLPTTPPVVGLWTADLDTIFSEPVSVGDGAICTTEIQWDVVYHGFDLEAKGSRWLEVVASHLPFRHFLFPVPRPARRSPPPNCHYVPMTWESGLEQAVRSAAITAVPSLWSAPIEGALVKSIAISKATAVVENPSAYAAELPNDLVLKLPIDPVQAAVALDEALRSGWRPARGAKAAWIDLLRHKRHQFLEELISAVPKVST